MAGATSPLSRYLRRRAGGDRSATDEQRLTRFVQEKDEAAFTGLVEEYGPLVWWICRSLLPTRQDAEDAFQATFLVLLRRASSIRKRQSLRCWLHGVAYRIAIRLKKNQGRQQLLAEPALVPAPNTAEEHAPEQAAILHEEIRRLPEKYRVPLLLYHLDERGRDETARLLGTSEGAIKGRLERGRKLLRERLVRRGLSGALIAVLTTPTLSPGRPPVPLINATLHLCLRTSLPGVESVPTRVVALAQGVVNAMLLARLKFYVVLACLLGGVGIGLGVSLWPETTVQAAIQEPAAATSTDHLTTLLRKREEVVREEFERRWQQFLAGQGTLELVINCSERWRDAQLELSDGKEARLACHSAHLKRMTETARTMQARFEAGRVTAKDGLFAEYARLDAEIKLERERAR